MGDLRDRVRELMSPEGSLRRHLLQGAIGNIALKVANAGIGMGVAIVLARALKPEGYGVYSFVLSVVILLATPAQMGLATLLVREIAKDRRAERWGRIGGLLRWSNGLVLGLSVSVVGVAVLGGWFFAEEIGETKLNTFVWGILLLPLIALGNLRGAALRGLKHVVQGQLPEMVLRPGLLLVIAGGVFAVGSLSPPSAMAIHAAAAGVAFIIGAWLLVRASPEPIQSATPEYDTEEWWQSAALLSLLGGTQIVNTQTDVVMLGFMASDEAVGFYRVAGQGSNGALIVLKAGVIAVAPTLASLQEEGEKEKLQTICAWLARAAVTASVLIGGVYLLFGEALLSIVFGNAYTESFVPLLVLTGGVIAESYYGAVSTLTNMAGHERGTLKFAALGAGLNILLNGALIPIWGTTGAALATATSVLVWKGLLTNWIKGKVGVATVAFTV